MSFLGLLSFFDFYTGFNRLSSRMLQMLSGPTLHRLSVTVACDVPGTGGSVDVDTHVRLSGGQDLRPYVDQPFAERFGSYLASLDHDVYQEFADALLKVLFITSRGVIFLYHGE